jgi:hypothetical protein
MERPSALPAPYLRCRPIVFYGSVSGSALIFLPLLAVASLHRIANVADDLGVHLVRNFRKAAW